MHSLECFPGQFIWLAPGLFLEIFQTTTMLSEASSLAEHAFALELEEVESDSEGTSKVCICMRAALLRLFWAQRVLLQLFFFAVVWRHTCNADIVLCTPCK
jgi:hypothetical protein